MNSGITILVILVVVTLGQLFQQGAERRRHHREIIDRLDRLLISSFQGNS